MCCGVSAEPAAGVGRGLHALSESEWWRLVAAVEQRDVRAFGVSSGVDRPGSDYEQAVWARNAAGVWLMGHAGLRVGELAKVPWSGVWGAGGATGSCSLGPDVAKGGWSRSMPLDGFCVAALERLRRCVVELPGAGAAIRVWGVGGEWRPGGVRRIRDVLAGLSVRAIARRVRPHELRHTYATRLNKVAKLRVVQDLLGHRSLGSTQRYLEVTWGEKADAVTALGK